MKRRLSAAIVVIMISMGLLACGSNASAPIDTVETAAATEAPEEVVSGEEENTEADEEADIEPEAENEEVPEQEESAPEWYMDEEGIKSEELGIMIRRDSAEWSQFGFSGSFMISLSDDSGMTSINFECNYYEGNIDSYISEHEEMQKDVLENITYAVREPNENNIAREVAFVGNGIALSVTLFDYDVEDIWDNDFGCYEEEQIDCLTYIRDETLYCPALGIKLSGVKKIPGTENPIISNQIGVYCSDTAGPSYEGGSILCDDSRFLPGNNVEEKLNNYVQQRVDYGGSAIDESVEKNVGNYIFLGKGSSDRYGRETWLLLSDETTWYFSLGYTEDYKLEDYLSVIEELK